ncbi:MAG: DEAD/DEAH box helicase [bacterium]
MNELPQQLLSVPDYEDQIEARRVLEAKPPETAPPPDSFPSDLVEHFPYDLYTHQAEALQILIEGSNVCVSTSTSSGKTSIYALEIARRYRENSSSTALLVYPTKALSSDQQSELEALYDQLGLDISIGVYDGDTTSARKREIRENADVIITNFAGLNYYLPHHRKWDRILSNLRTVVVEEAHCYSGILGMHAAWILRRLFRIIESDRYRSEPNVVLTSATIGNPRSHAERLTGKSVSVVDQDGSPRSRRDIVFWNPPKFHESSEQRKSSHRESSKLLAHLVESGHRMLMFAPSRKMTELDTRWVREMLSSRVTDGDARVESYHAGHTKDERRTVEQGLKESKLDGVVSTSALELGVNIGDVDGTILSGYPGSRQQFWQRLGRSGRNGRRALNILVGQQSALDQFIMRNPDYLLEGTIEDAVLDLDNNTVFLTHLRIAAHELPLTRYDSIYFGDRLEKGVAFLNKTGDVSGSLDSRVHYTGADRPETGVDLYGAGSGSFQVTLIEENEDRRTLDNSITAHRAYRDFHPGAIYLHKGQQYRVTQFENDPREPQIELEAVNVDYYTTSSRKPEISDVESKHIRSLGDYELHWGHGRVDEFFPFYRRKEIDSQSVKDTRSTGLDEPVTLKTDLLWITLPDELTRTVRQQYGRSTPDGESLDAFLGGIHAIEHGLVHMAPTELLIDKGDLGGLSINDHPDTGQPTIFLYDAVDGGLGFTRSMFERFRPLSKRTRTLIETCRCDGVRGCPSCVMDYRCGNDNSPLHTEAAVMILKDLIASLPE